MKKWILCLMVTAIISLTGCATGSRNSDDFWAEFPGPFSARTVMPTVSSDPEAMMFKKGYIRLGTVSVRREAASALAKAAEVGGDSVIIQKAENKYFVDKLEVWRLDPEHKDIMKAFFENPDPSVKWRYSSLLHESIDNAPFVDVVNELLRRGANVNAVYGTSTALEWAVFRSRTEIVKTLLDHKATVSVRALITASGMGDTESLKALLDHGADVNSYDKHGDTALIAAAAGGHSEAVKLLLDRGADVNALNVNSMTALGAAQKAGHTALAKMLAARGARPVNPNSKALGKALYKAIVENDLKLAESLTAQGAELSAKTRNDALMALLRRISRKTDNSAMVAYLLTSGVDMYMEDDLHQTPMAEAAGWGNAPVVKLLLDRGYDINRRDRYGRTPLIHACNTGSDAVMVLLARGADVTIKDENGNTVLMGPAALWHVEIVKALLARGADLHARNTAGRNSLMTAAEFGKVESVKFLLASGADLNARDNYGQTALEIAKAARKNKTGFKMSAAEMQQLDEVIDVLKRAGR